MATRRPPARRVVAAALLAGALGAFAGGCRGPRLAVPTDGVRIVDGRVTPKETLPFRYYGTTVVDVLPRAPAEPARAQAAQELFGRAPNRALVDVPEPVTPWVFPFDLPLELLATLFGGIDDRVAPVRTADAPATVVLGAVPGEVEQLRSRANAARLLR